MPVDETGQDPIGKDVGSGDARLTSLDARLKAAADAEKIRTGTAQIRPGTGYGQGSKVLTVLIAGPVGGALLGWFIDRLFGTSPWGLLVLMILGIASAFRQIYQISKQRPE